MQNLSYTYDAVGNITKIAQSAGPVNGLGGNYQNSYIYDDLNRLQHSFCKTGLFDYDFNITMSPTGRIGEKNLTYAAGAISSYQLNGYDRNFTTHQPRVIYDQVRGSQSLFWDANGNLSQTVDCKTGAASINFWDEENRLRLAVNPKFVGYYGYDANGERVYKLTGSTQYDDLNGSNPSFGIIFDGLTVYPSPYIVLTEKQYTKHYYAGTEKIATMIGDGGLLLAANHISNEQRSLIKDGFYRSFEPTAFQYEKTPNIDIEGKYQSQLEYACGYIDQANLYLMSNFPMLEPMMQIWQNSNGCRNEIYYTHGDQLGSANWITDADGKPIQYIHYAPYGELIANQQTIGYDERYKFTGKERDWETGYDYFGARFYDYRKGFWNSVDPLADKYPGNTPYLYCNGNPIMLVDPDGKDPGTPILKSKYAKDVTNLNYYQYRAQIEIDEGRKAPNYLLEYGDKYCKLFMLRTSEAMSDAGKIWCAEVCASLQSALEYAVTQDNWTDLVANPEEFLDFAYDSHVEAYLNKNGTVRFSDLPASDLILIGVTPDWKDIASFRGLKQVLKVAFNWSQDLNNKPFCKAKFLYNSVREGYNICSKIKEGDFFFFFTLKQLLTGVDE